VADSTVDPRPAATFTIAKVLPSVWLSGVAGQLLLLAWAARRMRRSLAGAMLSGDPRLLDLAGECAATMGLTETLRIFETDAVCGPAVIGLWRPRLLLPSGLAAQLSDEELRFVLLHECAHLRRRDLAALWLLTAARLVHWFNPLVWFAVRVARTDAELACDESVLRKTHREAPIAYGEALLKLAHLVTWRQPAWPVAGIVEGRRAMRLRLASIGRYAPGKAVRTWMAALIVIGVGLVFGADEKKESVKPPELSAVAAEATPPETQRPAWAKDWELKRLILPKSGPTERSNVHFRKSDGSEMIFSISLTSEDEVWAEKLEWLGNPPRAWVTLRKGEESAVFAVDPDKIERQGQGPAQIEIEAHFIEITATSAKRLKVTTAGMQLRDRAGLDALIAGLAGGDEMSVLTAPQHQDLIRALAARKGGMDLLSTPRMTTRSGQRAVIEIIREFRYPIEWSPASVENGVQFPPTPTAFDTRNCGVSLGVTPVLNEAGTVTLALVPQVVELLGYADLDSGKSYPAARKAGGGLLDRIEKVAATPAPSKAAEGHRVKPIFSARKIETSVTLVPGHAVLLLGARETEETEPFTSPAKSRRLVIVISAQLVDRGGFVIEPAGENRPAPASQAATNGERQPGVAVPEKPGFVTSPYSPNQGYVDVRGFPPGTEVKDPYSGKIFLVP
jgi:beta-lactamase regulating signal transducer with metallopeptidase domain